MFYHVSMSFKTNTDHQRNQVNFISKLSDFTISMLKLKSYI